MPPDLNSVPSSPCNQPLPHSMSESSSRRASQMTGTPLLPGVTSSGTVVQQEETNMPVRHPRPLTAAELHAQLEKEQEAVVNRLTRELAALRAQHSASVASTTSSSTSAIQADPDTTQQGTLPIHPTSSRRHRSSSSSVSTRSTRSLTNQSQQGTAPSTNASATPSAAPASQASVERARDAAGVRSRENSLVGVGLPMPSRSRAPSASPSPSQLNNLTLGTYFPTQQPHRQSVSSSASAYEEAAAARTALEAAMKENEMLAARVRELEQQLREVRKVPEEAEEGEEGREGAPVGNR